MYVFAVSQARRACYIALPICTPVYYVCVSCSCVQGISADILRRLPEWQFNIGCLEVRPADYLPAVDHPTALRNALTQLCEGLKWVEPPSRDQGRDPVADREADAWEILPKENEPVKPCLLLERWVWTPELVSELASLKPALVQRRLRGFKPRESS